MLPAVLNTPDRCSTDRGMDSATMIAVCGLKKKLTEFTFVLSIRLHVIHEILAETGPVSRQLQAADCDLSQATIVVRSFKSGHIRFYNTKHI
jgi:hypothetical protein